MPSEPAPCREHTDSVAYGQRYGRSANTPVGAVHETPAPVPRFVPPGRLFRRTQPTKPFPAQGRWRTI